MRPGCTGGRRSPIPEGVSIAMPAKVKSAIARGFDFLETAIDADGAWPSAMYMNLELTGTPRTERVPFVAALGHLSLRECPGARSERLRVKTRAYLMAAMEYPGVWRYWPSLPPDLDDTAVCSQAVGQHAWLALGRTLPTVFRKRDREGRFRTWMAKGDDSSAWDDVDSVVNANVVVWLGDRSQTRGAQHWLRSLIDCRRESGSSRYYPDTMDIHAALSRLGPDPTGVDGVLRGLDVVLVDRIMARYGADGHFGDPQRTAQALSALDRLEAWPAAESRRAADYLLQTQSRDGSWSSGIVWQGPPPPGPPTVGFVSTTLITAYCMEALARFARRSTAD